MGVRHVSSFCAVRENILHCSAYTLLKIELKKWNLLKGTAIGSPQQGVH